MKLTAKRGMFLLLLAEQEQFRKALFNYRGLSAMDLARSSARTDWKFSDTSANTYLRDLEVMGFTTHEQGLASTWKLTDDGHKCVKLLREAKKSKR